MSKYIQDADKHFSLFDAQRRKRLKQGEYKEAKEGRIDDPNWKLGEDSGKKGKK